MITVYVDELVAWGWSKGNSCHMSIPTSQQTPEGMEEFHRFAESIGLKRSWFQDHRVCPHYDLVASKRVLAIRKGAIVDRNLVNICKRKQGE